MDETHKQTIRSDIMQRLKALDAEDALGQSSQKVVELDQQAIGRLSRQDALISQSMAKAAQTRRHQTRAALQVALARLETDEFGYCEDCGDDIPAKRLAFDPTVTRCISCASG